LIERHTFIGYLQHNLSLIVTTISAKYSVISLGLKLNGIYKVFKGYTIFFYLDNSNPKTPLSILDAFVSSLTSILTDSLNGFLKLILPEYYFESEQVIIFSLNLVGGSPYPLTLNIHEPMSSLSNLISAVSPASNPEGIYQIVTTVLENAGILITFGSTSKLAGFEISYLTNVSFEEGFLKTTI